MLTYRPCRLPVLVGWSLAAWLIFGACRPAAAEKFMEARIISNDEVRLQASFGIRDTATPAEMWRELERVTFEATGPLAANPASREIQMAEIRIELIWVKTTEATAKVNRLRLVRVDEAGERWRLPADEVERTGVAAGLDVARSDLPWLVLRYAAPLAVLAVAPVIVWLRRRRAKAHDSPFGATPPNGRRV